MDPKGAKTAFQKDPKCHSYIIGSDPPGLKLY